MLHMGLRWPDHSVRHASLTEWGKGLTLEWGSPLSQRQSLKGERNEGCWPGVPGATSPSLKGIWAVHYRGNHDQQWYQWQQMNINSGCRDWGMTPYLTGYPILCWFLNSLNQTSSGLKKQMMPCHSLPEHLLACHLVSAEIVFIFILILDFQTYYSVSRNWNLFLLSYCNLRKECILRGTRIFLSPKPTTVLCLSHNE